MSLPSGAITAEVVGEPGLAQLTAAKKQLFSAALHRNDFSWNELRGSAAGEF